MTMYFPDGKDRPGVKLTAEKVTNYLNTTVLPWVRVATLKAERGPSGEEWEMGLEKADCVAELKFAQLEAKRLERVIECCKAGVTELPLELYP